MMDEPFKGLPYDPNAMSLLAHDVLWWLQWPHCLAPILCCLVLIRCHGRPMKSDTTP